MCVLPSRLDSMFVTNTKKSLRVKGWEACHASDLDSARCGSCGNRWSIVETRRSLGGPSLGVNAEDPLSNQLGSFRWMDSGVVQDVYMVSVLDGVSRRLISGKTLDIPARGDDLQCQDLGKNDALGLLTFLFLRMRKKARPITITASKPPTKPERMATMFAELSDEGRCEVSFV